MNAAEAKNLTAQAIDQLKPVKEGQIADLLKGIFSLIKQECLKGKAQLEIDLRQTFLLLTNDGDVVKSVESQLKDDGYKVSSINERSLFGKRKLIISW